MMQIVGFIICWSGAFLYGKHGKEIKPEHLPVESNSAGDENSPKNKNNSEEEMMTKIGWVDERSPVMKDIELGETPNLEGK